MPSILAIMLLIEFTAGAEFLASDLGMAVEDASVYQLGVARKVTISDRKTTIISDNATREEIQARVAQLKRDMAETSSTREAQMLSQRIAKLSGGVAVIKVYCSHVFVLLT